jgi:uncharacterized protein
VDRRRIISTVAHRPFALPGMPWVMQQAWEDLLFLHYPVAFSQLRDKVPASLELETFEGDAWVSISPFRMRDVRFRWLPPVPGATNFLELNLRTYVRHRGRSGVHFFSLDSSSMLSVAGARAVFLPYHRSRMSMTGDKRFTFRSERATRGEAPVKFEAQFEPKPGKHKKTPLETWLVERYRLFQQGPAGTIVSIDIHHAPWVLQDAEVDVRVNSLATPLGLDLAGQAPMTHFSTRQEVLVWPPRLSAGS